MDARRVIDPSQIIANSEDAHILGVLLSATKQPLWVTDMSYSVELNHQKIEVWLQHPILRRERLNNKRVNGDRYEVIGSVIAGGSYSRIIDSLQTLKVEKGMAVVCQTNKKRVIKFQDHEEQGETFKVDLARLEWLLMNENIHSIRARHLHAKPVVRIMNEQDETIQSFLVMRKFEGKSLADRIQGDAILRSWLRPFAMRMSHEFPREHLHLISLEDRIQLSINILRAVPAQVREQQAIHYDLKPDNMMVGEGNTITIIDFCGATEVRGQRHAIFVGSRAYLAPEARQDHPRFNPELLSVESDTYSVGVVLKNLWGDMSLMLDKHQPSFPEDLTRGLRLLKFENDRANVLSVLNSLTHEDIEQRGSLDQALKVFEDIQWQQQYLHGRGEGELTVENFKLAYHAEYQNTCRFFRNPCSKMLGKLKSDHTSPKTVEEIEAYAHKHKKSRTALVLNKIKTRMI